MSVRSIVGRPPVNQFLKTLPLPCTLMNESTCFIRKNISTVRVKNILRDRKMISEFHLIKRHTIDTHYSCKKNIAENILILSDDNFNSKHKNCIITGKIF